VLDEQGVADVADASRTLVRSAGNRFGQAVRAENLSAVSAVDFALLAEPVLAAVALVDVVFVLPANLK